MTAAATLARPMDDAAEELMGRAALPTTTLQQAAAAAQFSAWGPVLSAPLAGAFAANTAAVASSGGTGGHATWLGGTFHSWLEVAAAAATAEAEAARPPLGLSLCAGRTLEDAAAAAAGGAAVAGIYTGGFRPGRGKPGGSSSCDS
jgi:hypothetical protein